MGGPATAHRAPSSDLIVAVFLAFLTVFRLWYGGTHELVQDEAYYWQWSRHLAWGYYDNTPLAAFVIRFFVMLLGSNALGVRAGAVAGALVAAIFIYLIAKRLLGTPTAFLAVVLANVIPLFAAGSVIMTQDPVQIAFWAATVYVVSRAVSDRPRWSWWIGAGILAGLTSLAKLNGLLLLPSVFLYLLLSPFARQTWLRSPQPYVAGIVALAIFSPFVWWNHTHENAFWIHIGVMGSRSDSHDPPLSYFFNFLGAQFLLLSPFVGLTFLYTLYDGWKRGAREQNDAYLFLWCLSAVVFGATLLLSLRSKVEGNWAVTAYVTGIILVADTLWRVWQNRSVVWPAFNLALAVMLSIVALFPAVFYDTALPLMEMNGATIDPTKDRTNEIYGWHQMADRVAAERRTMGGDPFVFGINYRMPSEAAFYLPGQPQTYSLFLHDRANEYMFWEDPALLVGRNAVFINDSPNPDHFDDLRAVFRRIVPQPPLQVYRNPPYAAPIRVIQVVRCYGFKGYQPSHWQQGW